jgi:hypothetical protein
MGRVLKWGIRGFGLALFFGAGFVVGAHSHVGDPIVRVKLTNRATRVIRTVTVAHEHGTAKASDVIPGRTVSLRFFSPGETSLHTTVEFADGARVDSPELYAEAGYTITASVTDNGIEESATPYY